MGFILLFVRSADQCMNLAPTSFGCLCCVDPRLDNIAEEEDELAESARADEARFRAFRCFYVIEAFLAQKKVKLCLFPRKLKRPIR